LRDIDEFAQDLALGRRGLRQDVMECRHDRNSQGSDEVEDVSPVVAAPDGGVVLKTHNLDAAFVQRPRHIRVVGLDVASNAMSDFGRVWARLVGRVKGHDLTFADRGGQVIRERGYAAPARGVR
jgi:hypothetical protein